MAGKRRKGGRVPGAGGVQGFTKAELGALMVHDDIKLRLADAGDIPPGDGDRIPEGALPHWSAHDAAQEEGAAIAVWQMFAPPPGVDATLTGWLRKQGISYFRGWIRHAGPAGPDFMMDWVIPREDGTWEVIKGGDAGPYSPPAGCDLQTFVDAVASFSRHLLLAELETKFRMIGKLPGDPETVLREFFPLNEDEE